jgi:hypothetical protein
MEVDLVIAEPMINLATTDPMEIYLTITEPRKVVLGITVSMQCLGTCKQQKHVQSKMFTTIAQAY